MEGEARRARRSRAGGRAGPTLAASALGALAAGALGYRTFEGLGYRVVRAALIVAGLVSGQRAVALGLLAAVSAVAVAVRAANVAVQERRPSGAGRQRGPR